jgi:hypothetical protein
MLIFQLIVDVMHQTGNEDGALSLSVLDFTGPIGVSLSHFRFCLVVLVGNLFFPPQVLHSSTRTSACALLPRERFSTRRLQVWPSTRKLLHLLQIACFTVGDSLI